MRGREHLLLRLRSILSCVSLLMVPAGAVMALPALAALVRAEEGRLAVWFLLPGLSVTLAGVVGWRRLRPAGELTLSMSEGMTVVALAWFLMCTVGAVPLAGAAGLNLTQAVFESVSAWTTTGLSVVNVEAAAWSVLIYRSLLQLAGGAGFVIVALSALVGPAGTGLPSAEGRQDQLVPNAQRSARLVARMYGGLALAGWVLLWLAGMDGFAAFNHSCTAVSTGGFSTSAASVGAWDSPIVEGVCMALMMLGNTSFVTTWALLTGRLRQVFRATEIRLFLLLTPAAAVVLLSSTLERSSSWSKAVRVAVFEAVSAFTTTGFSTTSYSGWPSAAILLLIVLMMVGGGAGSTAGGLKQLRVAVLLTAARDEVRRRLLPTGTVVQSHVEQGGRRSVVDGEVVRSTAGFAVLYGVTFLAGMLALCAYHLPLDEAAFEMASALSTVGLSVGVTSPTCPDGVLWTLTVSMFVGRLELVAVLVGLASCARIFARLLAGVARGR